MTKAQKNELILKGYNDEVEELKREKVPALLFYFLISQKKYASYSEKYYDAGRLQALADWIWHDLNSVEREYRA